MALELTDGYLPRGYRQNEFSDERGATRAVKMLLIKIKGESYLRNGRFLRLTL